MPVTAEHAELRRMGEPAPDQVVKLERTPDDDPFYTEASHAAE